MICLMQAIKVRIEQIAVYCFLYLTKKGVLTVEFFQSNFFQIFVLVTSGLFCGFALVLVFAFVVGLARELL